MPKVSIIVPVYNSEKHLEECLQSLANQTLEDIEIICVDSESSDKSAEILGKYTKSDNRIRCFYQKNSGVSSARNFALSQVKGEFVLFVDSDDMIERNTCEILYDNAKKLKTEILLFSYYSVNKTIKTQDLRLKDFCKNFSDKITSFSESFEKLFTLSSNVCGKFYSTKFLKDNKILFNTKYKFGEDRLFFYTALVCSKSISALDMPLYYYRIDSENSLTKTQKTCEISFKINQAIKRLIFSLEDVDKNNLYKSFLEYSAVNNLLFYWNDFANKHLRSENLKYLIKLRKELKKYYKKEKILSKSFSRLDKEIKNFQYLFLRKFFEPIFELELRRNRIVLYLFERQVLNFSTRTINILFHGLKYLFLLIKLRYFVKKRPIRVGFWMSEHQKWSSFESIYKAMQNNKNFYPFVLLSSFKKLKGEALIEKNLNENIEFLEKNNIKYEVTYNAENQQFLSLKQFKPDVVFYQQPWQIPDEQNLKNTSKFALTCYIPYCYYSLDSYINYLFGFHGCIWKYFVESEMHKREYEQKYNAKNCIALGSTKLDKYKNLDDIILWKTNKKKIIYAPHHTFNYEYNYQMATFEENGNFILDYAKMHPEFEWIFRPHPSFKEKILQNNIMSSIELERYYKDWEDLGSVYTGANYYELFNGSDCLITDCISFLTEYLPTKKPVIHLRKDSQNIEFNNLLKTVIENYYQVYDNKYLKDVLEEILEKNNDYLKEKRINSIKNLMIDEKLSVGQKITNYLMQQLGIKENK